MDKSMKNKVTAEVISGDPQMKKYFDSLPQMIRESVLMSGVEITDAEQLRSVAENLMRRNS